MAQFTPFSENVKVNGQTILTFINAITHPASKERMGIILKNNGIEEIKPDGWYSQKAWLDAFKEINDSLGPNTLFTIGKAIPENAKFPPEINNLEKALGAIDIAYKMNHKGGDIGFYKLLSFDGTKKTAQLECKNPYPSDFDRGIIMTMLRKFKPANSIKYDVVLDTSKPNRLKGADSCTYTVTW